MPNLNQTEPNKTNPTAALYSKHYWAIYNVCSPQLQQELSAAVNSDTYSFTVRSLIKKVIANAEHEMDNPPRKQLTNGKTKIPVE
jgi:hypothetical protein